MKEIINITNLNQFEAFKNDKNIIEICVRNGNKRFKQFFNVAINDLQQNQTQEVAEKALNALNKNSDLLKNGINQLNNVTKLQQLGLLMNGMNLCATVVGFAIINKKLNNMSDEIVQQFNEIKLSLKKGNDAQNKFEFNKVLSEHNDMLDHRKTQKPYSEEQMRKLVDMESNVLKLLISMLDYDISFNKEDLIFSILSMLSMMTASLRYFDELYYLNNHKVIGDNNPWHGSHDTWMMNYDVLKSEKVIKLIQDSGFLDMKLSTNLTDELCMAFVDQVKDLKQDVIDNQKLVSTIGDAEAIKEIKEFTCNEVKKALEDAFKEAFSDNAETKKVYKEALNQAVQAA